MNQQELDAIRARADAATRGPWNVTSVEWAGCFYVEGRDHEPLVEDDRDFIAHARADIPALLDALDAAVAAIERLKKQGAPLT